MQSYTKLLNEKKHELEIQTAVATAVARYAAAADAPAEAAADPEPEAVVAPADPPTDTTTTVYITLNDDTEVGDDTWADIKDAALADGYKTTDAFTTLPEDQQALICALIAAEGEKTVETITINTETVYVVNVAVTDQELLELTDPTAALADGTTWAAYKATATAPGYTETTAYTELSEEEMIRVGALIAVQAAVDAADDGVLEDKTFSALVETTTRTGPIADATPFTDASDGETTWAAFKATAMAGGFKETAAYTDLDAATMGLIDALIDAQTALGSDDADLPYGDDLIIVSRVYTVAEDEIICPIRDDSCPPNPYGDEYKTEKLVLPEGDRNNDDCRGAFTTLYNAYTLAYNTFFS